MAEYGTDQSDQWSPLNEGIPPTSLFCDYGPNTYIPEDDEDLFPGLHHKPQPLGEQRYNEYSKEADDDFQRPACSIACCDSPECGSSMEELWVQCCDFEGCPDTEEYVSAVCPPDTGAAQANEPCNGHHENNVVDNTFQSPVPEATSKERFRDASEDPGAEPQNGLSLLDNNTKAQSPHLEKIRESPDADKFITNDERLRDTGESVSRDSRDNQTSSKTASRKRKNMATQESSETDGGSKENKQLLYRCRYPWARDKDGNNCTLGFNNMSNQKKHEQTHWGTQPYGCPYAECKISRVAKPDNLRRHLESGACQIHKHNSQPMGNNKWPLPANFKTHTSSEMAKYKAIEGEIYERQLQQWTDAGNDKPPDRGWAHIDEKGKFQKWCDEPPDVVDSEE